MTAGWRARGCLVVVVSALMLVLVPVASAVPGIKLDVLVNTSCGGVHCESEVAEFACSAQFVPSVGAEVAISTSVACYTTESGVEVVPGATAVPGPIAVAAGAATIPYGGDICVAGSASYLRNGGVYNITSGPICRSAYEWPNVIDVLPDS